ncbi:MAG TPA: PAS domain-containing sensor histidine kinase [Candidatus Saccharimonadales bacterium]
MPPSEPRTPIASLNLEEQRVLAEALFTSIGDGAIATDEFGKITRINPTALKILGFSEREMIGAWFPKKIVSLHENGEPVSLIDRPITRAFLTGKTIVEKMYYRKKNGQVIPVSITVSPIMLAGKPVGAIEVFRDITIEYEIDRMKSDFISLASHQLRTPLSAIKTYSHMLIDGYMGDITSAQKKSLRTIVSAANRMNELISTLLNITRMESGNVTVTLKTVDVQRLVEEVNKEHALAASDKEITLSVQVKSATAPTVQTDALLFKEVLSNLVSNAIKYTPEGGNVEIGIKNRRYDVLFSITDTGMGIPRYSQEQIFTKFFRAHNVVKQETSGTGLGLYLVKGLVDALGGKIWFESTENKGTTFYVCLSKTPTVSETSANGED